jgi:DNA polymerase
MRSPAEWLPRTERIPEDLLAAVNDPDVLFHAFNAQFERPVWRYALRRMKLHRKVPDIPIKRWRCTAYLAAANGLARSLNGALSVLGSTVLKDPEGDRLIKKFSKPRKPTKADPRTRILPEDDPKDFKAFSRYCRQDVVAEMALADVLHEMHPRQEELYLLDMRMNERGLPLDMPMVRKARAVLRVLEARINAEATKLSGGIRPTQVAKMKELFASLGVELENMKAQTVKDLLKDRADIPRKVKRLLLLRVEAGKASTKKLATMELVATDGDMQDTDGITGIVQGSFLIHGAHTGRYAGRLVQPQNFIRGTLKPHQQAFVFNLLDMVDNGWDATEVADLFTVLYEWPIDVISQCMRGFIRAPQGYEFYVVDYTAIEARVLAWVAGEERILKAYRQGLDVYKLMASRLFGIPVDQVDSEQRRIAKNLVLGCGYSLGGVRFVDYSANAGVFISEMFAKKAVKVYRDDHPNIV